jgi:hypothetical protein
MDVSKIVEIISNVGFPIVVAGFLVYVLYQFNLEMKENNKRWIELLYTSSKEWQTVINNNTQAMNGVLNKLQESNELSHRLEKKLREQEDTKIGE